MKVFLQYKKVLLVLILIPILVYGVTALYIGSKVYESPQGKADAIIVLGARSYLGNKINPCLAARIDEAARLYKENAAKYIILSGGKGETGIVEAETMADLLQDGGIDSESIILESRATSTFENLVFSQELMKEHGFKSAIIVTEPFHTPRASLIASKLGINNEVSGAQNSPCWSKWKFASRYFLREPLVILIYKLQGKI